MNIKTTLLLLIFYGTTSLTHADVGFFSPDGVPEQIINKVQFGMFNAINPAQVEKNITSPSGTQFKTSIDLTLLITHPIPVSKVTIQYIDNKGTKRTKLFHPEQDNKLRSFAPDQQLRNEMAPILDVMAKHPTNIDTIFLADEPYLNGISKSEMERAGRIAREELNRRGLKKIKLGVIFASGMFNKEFAQMIESQSASYVSSLDEHLNEQSKTNPTKSQTLIEVTKHNRLVTYDRTGNMFLGGGLPKGFEVVGFDFYLSTLLLDALHEHSLEFFAKRFPHQFNCDQFSKQPMSTIRSQLSFFKDGAVLQGDTYRVSDKKLLDSIFECRMGALTEMLKTAAKPFKGIKPLMISESSSNGVWEFDSTANIEKGQPELLVESRVLDEVKRAQDFYDANKKTYLAGLMYFIYQNAYDYSISLKIYGAEGLPSVLASIFNFSETSRSKKNSK